MAHLGSVCLLVAAMTLVASAVHHLSALDGFRADIASQRVVPAGITLALAVMTTVAELLLASLLVSLAIGVVEDNALRLAGPSLAALLFLSYALYASALVRFRPGAPCGCGTTARPASAWTVVRAVSLSVIAAASFGSTGLTRLSPLERTTIVLMSFVSAIAIWALPEALHIPGWRGTADKYAELRQ